VACGFYNHRITWDNGKEIINSGWRTSGITDAILFGTLGIPSIDPFNDINDIEHDAQLTPIANSFAKKMCVSYLTLSRIENSSD
jgi:hypothetical protein